LQQEVSCEFCYAVLKPNLTGQRNSVQTRRQMLINKHISQRTMKVTLVSMIH